MFESLTIVYENYKKEQQANSQNLTILSKTETSALIPAHLSHFFAGIQTKALSYFGNLQGKKNLVAIYAFFYKGH